MSVTLLLGDCREKLTMLKDKSIHTCVTSPPYFGLRDYGHDDQIGLETTPDDFINAMVTVFREVRRVLRDDGTLWLNLGDTYNNRTKVRTTSHQPALNGFEDDVWKDRAARGGVRMSNMPGIKEKDLIGIPWRVAFALQADGWFLRQDIIWAKSNPMPESVTDRCTKAHEYIFLLSKSPRYYFDSDAIKEPAIGAGQTRGGGKKASTVGIIAGRADGQRMDQLGAKPIAEFRNRRSVWNVSTKPFKGAHFATFPPDLIEPCILAGCPVGGVVLDPFGGAGTTGLVAERNGRESVLIELNLDYVKIIRERLGVASYGWNTAVIA
jgi:DNA modification methylase